MKCLPTASRLRGLSCLPILLLAACMAPRGYPTRTSSSLPCDAVYRWQSGQLYLADQAWPLPAGQWHQPRILEIPHYLILVPDEPTPKEWLGETGSFGQLYRSGRPIGLEVPATERNSELVTWQLLSDHYAVSHSRVYYQTWQLQARPGSQRVAFVEGWHYLPDADPVSFRVLPGSAYALDRRQVWYLGQPLAAARPDSFRLLPDNGYGGGGVGGSGGGYSSGSRNDLNDLNDLSAGAAAALWWSASNDCLRYLTDGPWASDGNQYWWGNQPLGRLAGQNSPPEDGRALDFQPGQWGWFKLEDRWWQVNGWLDQAADKSSRPASEHLVIIDASWARDGSQLYLDGRPFAGLAADSFESLGQAYARDAHAVYWKNRRLALEPSQLVAVKAAENLPLPWAAAALLQTTRGWWFLDRPVDKALARRSIQPPQIDWAALVRWYYAPER